MKKAIFVTNGHANEAKTTNQWKSERPFNSRDQELAAGEGLLIFRLDFDFASDAGKAVIRASALGVFDMLVNGVRVGKVNEDGSVCYDELKPEWTDYRHRIMEYEYDITPFCRIGANTVVAEVSGGWWSGAVSFGMYGNRKSAFCAELEAGGKLFPTGSGAWKTAIGGRIRTADIWNGEYYDAREPDPTFEPEKYTWEAPVPFDGPYGEIIPRIGSPLRVKKNLILTPKSAVVHNGVEDDGSELGHIRVIRAQSGEGCEKVHIGCDERLILDFGQNMVGRPRISFHGALRGVKISVCVAEFLNDSGETSRGNDGPNGSMYLKNYRHALARAVYVSAGEEKAVYEPTHTYYGFRYIEIYADGDVTLDGVWGVVVGSDIKETGMIETDNDEVNRLFSNIVWGMRGNYFSNPTDCPQRDERLGWTGDTQIFCGAGSYIADIRDFMRKWLGDVRASQMSADGKVCDVIPAVFRGQNNYNNTAWGDAAVVVPYRMWLMYRDDVMLAEHYDAMESYMASLEAGGLDGAGLAYGDWLSYENTDKRYIAVCYYAYDAEIMEKLSLALAASDEKYRERAEYYHALHDRIVAHFRENYIKDGELTVTSQTGYLLALRFSLVGGETAEKVKKLLRKKITDNGYLLSTGFVGTGILNQTLDRAGMDDLAYSLLLQTRDPSWLYSVRQGATTVWERWNSYTLERGFGDVGMNSFNHYAYGAVAEWMFSSMAGIMPDEENPGFSHFYLAPKPDTRKGDELPEGQKPIRHVKAHFDVSAGRIESEWTYDSGEKLTYRFTIPDETTATVIFPSEAHTLTRDGKELGVKNFGVKYAGGFRFELESGKYVIE